MRGRSVRSHPGLTPALPALTRLLRTLCASPCTAADILITTPLRLVFALKSNLVSLATCEHLVLDEADKLFELNFLEQTDEILAACGAGSASESGTGSRVVRKGMFSATMPSTVEELAKGVMAGAGSGMIRAIVGHKCVPPSLLCISVAIR